MNVISCTDKQVSSFINWIQNQSWYPNTTVVILGDHCYLDAPLNNFIKLGTAKEFSKIIGDAFVDTLIGTEENPGFAYILKDIGVTDFSFTTEDNMDYFVLNK